MYSYNFTGEQWRIIIVNAVGVVNLFFLCSTFVALNRRGFLLLQGLSPILLLLMYALSGLWISVVSTAAMMLRNIYNASPRMLNALFFRRGEERPLLSVNMALLIAMVALSIYVGGGVDRVHPDMTYMELLMEYLPIVSLIACSLAIFFIRSYGTLIAVFFADSALWAVYDLRYMVLMALVADLISIVMTIVKALLAVIDRKNGAA